MTVTYMTYRGGGGLQSTTGTVAVAPDGKIQLWAYSAVDMLVDIQGYYTAGSPTAGGFVPVTPSRLVDTRSGIGLPSAPAGGSTTTIQVAGHAGVPADASAAVVTLSESSAGTSYYQTTYAADQPRPGTSEDFSGADARSLTVQVGLSARAYQTPGAFNLYLSGSGYSVTLIVDVIGYFESAAGGGGFTAAAENLFDTHVSPNSPIASHGTAQIPVAGVNGLPTSGLSAVVVRLSAYGEGTSSGWMSAWADQLSRPNTTAITYPSKAYVTNMAVLEVGPGGGIQVYNGGADPVSVIVDVEGWYSATPAAPLIYSLNFPPDTSSPDTGAASSFQLAAPGTPGDLDDFYVPASPAVSFVYSLDGGSPISVAAPQPDGDAVSISYAPSAGPHTFTAYAVDANNLDSTTAVYSWTVGPSDPNPDAASPIGQAADNIEAAIEAATWPDSGDVQINDDETAIVVSGKGVEPQFLSDYIAMQGYGAFTTYNQAPYSLAELSAEQDRLFDSYPGEIASSSVNSDLTGVQVSMQQDQSSGDIHAYEEVGTVTSSYPVTYDAPSDDQDLAPTSASRNGDISPLFGGALIRGASAGACGTGMAVKYGTKTGLVTAAHCGKSTFRAFSSGAYAGSVVKQDWAHDIELLSGSGSYGIWTGGYNSTRTALAYHVHNPVWNQKVCAEGAVSGETCTTKTGLGLPRNNGINTKVLMYNSSTHKYVKVGPGFWIYSSYGQPAKILSVARAGDSGSPVISYSSNSRYATVYGFIDAVNNVRYPANTVRGNPKVPAQRDDLGRIVSSWVVFCVNATDALHALGVQPLTS